MEKKKKTKRENAGKSEFSCERSEETRSLVSLSSSEKSWFSESSKRRWDRSLERVSVVSCIERTACSTFFSSKVRFVRSGKNWQDRLNSSGYA